MAGLERVGMDTLLLISKIPPLTKFQCRESCILGLPFSFLLKLVHQGLLAEQSGIRQEDKL